MKPDYRRHPPVSMGCVVPIGIVPLVFLCVASLIRCVVSFGGARSACINAGAAALGAACFGLFCYGLWWFVTPPDQRAAGFAWRALGGGAVLGAVAGAVAGVAGYM